MNDVSYHMIKIDFSKIESIYFDKYFSRYEFKLKAIDEVLNVEHDLIFRVNYVISNYFGVERNFIREVHAYDSDFNGIKFNGISYRLIQKDNKNYRVGIDFDKEEFIKYIKSNDIETIDKIPKDIPSDYILRLDYCDEEGDVSYSNGDDIISLTVETINSETSYIDNKTSDPQNEFEHKLSCKSLEESLIGWDHKFDLYNIRKSDEETIDEHFESIAIEEEKNIDYSKYGDYYD